MSSILKALFRAVLPSEKEKQIIQEVASQTVFPSKKPQEENFYFQQRTQVHDPYPHHEKVLAKVNLYLLENQVWKQRIKSAEMTVSHLVSDQRQYQVEIRNHEQKIMLQFFLSPHMIFTFKPKQHTLSWSLPVHLRDQAFQVEFLDTQTELEIADLWNRGIFEVASQQDGKKALKSQSDRDWIHFANLDTDQVSQPTPTSEWHWRNSTQIENPKIKSHNQNHNGHMVENLLYNQLYINQGEIVNIYQYLGTDPSLKHRAQFPIVKEHETFSPTQILLSDESKKMLILSDSNTTQVTQLDLSTGKIIQEFGVSPDWHIKELAPLTKLGAMDGNQEILAVNNNSVFSLDPRQNGTDKLAQIMSYPTAPGFSCIVTDQSGHIVTATRTGQIRLYSDITKKAKTLLPGLGDGIIGLDITEDGAWVLATTLNYILLIPTIAKDTGLSGFKSSISQSAPAPIKLQLSPEDMVKYSIKQLNFSKASFNTGADEELILTSTGPYQVIWNLKKIKAGNGRYQYQIKPHTHNVTSNQFRYQHKDQIVVAETQDVYIQHQ